MSTILTRKGADYSLNARKFTAPVSAGLQGWWYLGGMAGDDTPTALARTTKNLAGTTNAMVATGSPTISTGFVTVDNTHSLDTTVPETLDFTYMVLGQPFANTTKLGGYYVSSTRSTMIAAVTPFTTMQGWSPRDAGSGTTTQANCGGIAVGAQMTAMHIYSFKITSATGVCSVRDLTVGLTASPVTLASARVLASTTLGFQLGGAMPAGCSAKVGFVAVYNRALSNAEEDSIRTFVAKYRLAKYGDVV